MRAHDNDQSSRATERSSDPVLDELLEALRSDQGGARTEAIKRALERESGPRSEETERIAALELKVAQLSSEIEADTDDGDGAVLEDVRSELDATVDELATLRSAVDACESTDAALESRIDDLEAAVTELADRLASVEESIRSGRSERAAARDAPDDAAGSGEPSEDSMERDGDDVAKRIRHVETKLDTRTNALASRLREIETLADRIDDLEERIDARTAVLESGLENVNDTMEEAITLLREETQTELSDVRSDLDDLDRELRSSIESLEDDIGALETHAADMTLWRNSIEGSSEGPEGDRKEEGE